MSLKEAKILEIALGELGHHEHELPHPGRYFAAGYNWCSEFVSWVYKAAGYPFTGGSFSSRVGEVEGDNGDWMLRSSERIINYFKEKNCYIHRSQPGWYNVVPKPGDYIFIGRYGTDRMHSGIVEYLSCRGTLHTIEGNNAGRKVMRFEYPNYQINEKDNGPANGIILGIGVIV